MNRYYLVLLCLVVCSIATIVDLQPWLEYRYQRIGHADEAEVALLGLNISEGQGAVVDCYWLLHGEGHVSDSLPRPEGYWSVYLGYWMALFFKIFGPSRWSVLMAASICKTGIGIAVSFVLLNLTKSKLAALTGLLLVLFQPQMTSRINGYSDIHLTFAMVLSAVILVHAWRTNHLFYWCLAGVFSGIAVGIKPSGLISIGLLVAICGYSWFFLREDCSSVFRNFVVGSLGFVIGCFPLCAYNYQSSGSIIWPEFSRVQLACSQYNIQNVVPSQAFYDPELTTQRLSFGSKEYLKIRSRNLLIYALDYCSGVRIHPIWFLPFIGVAVSNGARFFNRTSSFQRSSVDAWILVVMLLNAAGALLALFLDCQGRYWNFLVPVHVVISVYYMHSFHRAFVYTGFLVAIVVAIVGTIATIKTTIDGSEIAKKEKVYRLAFSEADAVIPQDATVMTSNPWEFSFHTRRKSIVVPYNPKPEVLLDVAQRFSAEYLVVINNDIRNPILKSILASNPPEFLETVHKSEHLWIAKIRRQNSALPSI